MPRPPLSLLLRAGALSVLLAAAVAVGLPNAARATAHGPYAPGWGPHGPIAHIAQATPPAPAPPPPVTPWPDDPGPSGQAGGWKLSQWNLDGPFSVNAAAGWGNVQKAGHPGGRGTVIAVLDTGVAYRTAGRYKRSPDFSADDFVRGYDFVGRDSHPDDENGHGTHVAGTIGEDVNNGVGLAGIAYGARIMPIRVLDSVGEGDVPVIARGVRWAARHGANVINLSLEFSPEITARDIHELLEAIRYARRLGTLVVGASGNEGHSAVAYPARTSNVLSVGATTERGCLSDFSNEGTGLDIVAPGGGRDAAPGPGDVGCDPNLPGRSILQLTYTSSLRQFGYPDSYEGTSMAAPHVSAAAALVIASGVLGATPSPAAVEQRLMSTARDLGTPGYDTRYGAGLLDIGKATSSG